jgi:hypothetical protein
MAKSAICSELGEIEPDCTQHCAVRRDARGKRVHAAGLGETGPLSQGVQAGRNALRIRYINGMEVHKKRPRGFKKEAQGVQVSPLNPLSIYPCRQPSSVLADPAPSRP